MSGQKPRSGGKLAPKSTAGTRPKRLLAKSKSKAKAKAKSKSKVKSKAKSTAQGSQSISIVGLTGLVGYLVSQAQVWVFRDFNRRLAPLDLRPAQYSALSVVRDNPGLSQMALGHVLGMGRSGIVPLLDALEARTLLARGPAADRRSHALHLTAAGSVLLAQADALVQRLESRIIDKIGRRNHEQLLEILKVFGRPDND